MACDSPLQLRRSYETGKTYAGEKRHWLDSSFTVSCMKCIGCRIERERQWTVRILHEAKRHDCQSNHFLTLTYDWKYCPEDYSLVHRDFQLFMKRLRKAVEPAKVRFFMCGEYGEEDSRPHFHAIVFGLQIPDLEPWRRNKRGDLVYKSEFIANIWGNGFITVGKVNETTAAYVSGYLTKDGSRDFYEEVENGGFPHPVTGERVFRKPPYQCMSTNPGIGADWIDEFYPEVFRDDSVVVSKKTPKGRKNVKAIVPKYYLRRLEKLDPSMALRIKEKRSGAREAPEAKARDSDEFRSRRAAARASRLKNFKRGSL